MRKIKLYLLRKLIFNKKDIKFDISKVKKILIMRVDRIGDMLLTFPLIELIKKHYPNIQIDIYASKTNYELVSYNKNVSDIYITDETNKLNDFKTLLKLRKNNYDLVIDMREIRLSNSLLRVKIIDGKTTVCMDKYRNKGLSYDDLKKFYYKIFAQEKAKHIVEKNLEILEIFNIKDKKFSREIDTNPKYDDFYKKYIQKDKINILFNIEGSDKEKILNKKQIEKILNGIRRDNLNIILISTARVYYLIKDFKNVQTVEVSSIFQTISLVRHSDIILTPDTSVIHFASILNKKVVGFYSNNELNCIINGPFSDDYKIVKASGDLGVIGLNEQEVIEAVKGYID